MKKLITVVGIGGVIAALAAVEWKRQQDAGLNPGDGVAHQSVGSPSHALNKNGTSEDLAQIVAQAPSTTLVTTTRVPSQPHRAWGQMTEEQKRWTAEAKPTEKTTLRLLDLSKVPTEKDLRMAGQLGDELQPTRSADPAALADAAARKKQEADNLDFGKAIQKWNLHEYDEAQLLFVDHLTKFPESPWAAESELHLGCASQYLAKYDEAQKWFEASQSRAPLGHPMHQKALLRLGVVAMDRGELDKATELFARLRQNDSDPSRMTYASYWIRALGLMKAKQTALRDCGQKSLGEICSVLGLEMNARELKRMEAAGTHGFTIQELEQTARRYGMAARTVRASGSTLRELPLPLVAHYRDQHFVAVLGREGDGKVKVYDTRVGHVISMTHAGFVSQWSGLATVFAGVPEQPGIRLASVQETQEAIGGCCGEPRYPDDLGDECNENECSPCRGMPAWQVNPVNMNLLVRDTPMWWDAPYGPNVDLQISYNSLDSLIDVRPFGPKWTFAYASYLVVEPGGAVLIIRGDARAERFTPDGNGGYNPDARVASKTLRKLSGSNFRFELELAGGTKHLYDVPSAMGGGSASSLLLSITDKYGTALTITHNAQGAITGISHPAAVTTLSPTGTWSFVYGSNGKVSHIDDPFGRQAAFTYDIDNRLTGQTDMGGVSYGYGYTVAALVTEPDPEDPSQTITHTNELFLNAITTPSGATQFLTEPSDGIQIGSDTYAPPGGPMWSSYRITITDPVGSQEEYFYAALYTGWHRDKNHYKAGVPAYGGASNALTDPHTRYYYALVNGKGELSRVEHQGGGTTYYNNYTQGGQTGQLSAPDGASHSYQYNSKGSILSDVENGGPTYSYEYDANGIDVLKVTRSVEGVDVVITETEYDPVTRDITATVDEAGFRTEFVRNAKGQVTAFETSKGDVTTLAYDARGRLEQMLFQANGYPNPIVVSAYVHDEVGRVVSELSTGGLTLIHEYDDLNRKTKTTYPDTTFVANTYDCCNLTSKVSREGEITRYAYDALKRIVSVVSPGRQIVSYKYDKVGNLVDVQFGRGEHIRWEYDDGSRKTAKIYSDGTRQTFGYDRDSGRLTWVKDAQNRQTTYTYNGKGLIQSVSLPDLTTQSFAYNAFGEKTSWSDGSRTTTYSYDTLGRLATVDGPLSDDELTYEYDQWGRLSSWGYAGGVESYTFDSLDRIVTVTNPLGTFNLTYDPDGRTIERVDYPIAGVFTHYGKSPVDGVNRLTEIVHESASGEIARFDYGYNLDGAISSWGQKQPGLAQARSWDLLYEAAGPLSSVLELPVGVPPPNPQKVWRYQYDASGNRVLAQESNRTRTASYNASNQLNELSSGGATWFRGAVNEAAQVSIDGQVARVFGNGAFESILNLGPGLHDVPVQAKDKAGNTTTETWRVDNGPTVAHSHEYDLHGNLLADGSRIYDWDAVNRMTSISKGADTWQFVYDGANRRVEEKKNGALAYETVWQDTSIVEERIEGGTKHRYWSYGVEILNSAGVQTGKRYFFSQPSHSETKR